MTYPRNTKTIKKQNRWTTDLDDYDHEAAQEVIQLAGLDRAKFLRQAIRREIELFHSRNSINRDPIQQDLLSVGNSS